MATTVRLFDGTSGFLDIGERVRVGRALDGASVLTIVGRVRLDAGWSANGNVISINTLGADAAGVVLRVLSTREASVAGRSVSSDSFQNQSGSTALATGTWHSLMGVIDFATPSQAIHINGTAAADGSGTPTFGNSSFTAGAAAAGADRIGAGPSATANNFFNGALCDVAVFTRALSSAEWSAFHGGDRPDQLSGGEPVLYWPLDDDTDGAGLFAHPRIGGVVGINGGGVSTFATLPTLDAHVSNTVENKFRYVRGLRLDASDASSVGAGNAVSSIDIQSLGGAATGSGSTRPTYQTGDILRFDGTDDYLEANIGQVDLSKGFAVIAAANVDVSGRILSLASATTREENGFGFSPTVGLVLGDSAATLSLSTFTDYTPGVTGNAIFSGRFSGNQTANWLNGARRNGTVTNATELSNGDILPSNIPSSHTTQLLQIGRRLHSTSSLYCDMDLYGFFLLFGAVSDEEIQYYEGVLAHDLSWTSLLASGHPWKSTAPTISSVMSYPWGHQIVARSADPANMFLGSPSIERHDSKLYASHDFFAAAGGSFHNPSLARVYVSDDEGASWSGVTELEDVYHAKLFEHTDGNLYMICQDGGNGNIKILKSTDSGVTWTATTLSNGTLLTAAGSGTTAPSYRPGGASSVVYHDDHVFIAFANANGSPPTFAEDWESFVLYCDTSDDLMTASNWSVTGTISVGTTAFTAGPASLGTPGIIEPNPVFDDAGAGYLVIRFTGDDTSNRAAFVPMTWNGTTDTLTLTTTWNDSMVNTMPGGNVRFGLYKLNSRFYSLTNNNHAVADAIGAAEDEQQRNEVTLVYTSSADLSSVSYTTELTFIDSDDIESETGLSASDAVTYVGFQYPASVLEGPAFKTVWRVGWSGAEDYHNANFIGYGVTGPPQTSTMGLVTETDTAPAIAPMFNQTVSLSIVTETDTAPAIVATDQSTIPQPTERPIVSDRLLRFLTNNRVAMTGLFTDRDRVPAVQQHEDDSLQYVADFSDWLNDGVTISSQTITPTGLTVSNVSLSSQAVTFTASALAQDPGDVMIQITASDGQVLNKKLRFYKEDC